MANRHKKVAKWCGGTFKILQQYCVSILSYIINPFVLKDSAATKRFFKSVYTGRLVDDLIFDGGILSYYDKASELLDIKHFNKIVDCGCGRGGIRLFFQRIGVQYDKYIGIDFAIENTTINERESLISCDLSRYEFDVGNDDLVVFCNSMCYLPDAELDAIIGNISCKGASVLIVDPVPSLFWDATFNRVQLYYRTIDEVKELMAKNRYVQKGISIDYLMCLRGHFIRSLSYASMFTPLM